MKRVMYSGAGLLLIALAFLLFNSFSGLVFTHARLDLTEQKLYTISEGTKTILEGLDKPIELDFFYSDEATKGLVALRNYARRVEELLRAYERESGGKLKLHVVDPEPFSEEEDRAAELGLQAVPLNQGGDKVYFGLAATNAEGRKDGLKDSSSINVIAVADTDLLADRMWVQVQDFFGQRMPQPWADNGTFVVNALDNLSGTDALISVRSRGRFARPFVVVEELQRQAENRFREKEEALQQRLAATEAQLAELQGPNADGAIELTAEQQAALQRYMQEKLRIRKELREVRYQLNADIDALGRLLKFFNIALVPLVLTLGVLLTWLWRRRRTA